MLRLLFLSAAIAIRDAKSKTPDLGISADITQAEKELMKSQDKYAKEQLKSINDQEEGIKNKYTGMAVGGVACLLVLVGLLVSLR